MYVKKFHKLPSDFIYQVKKDSWKDAMCKKQGILLIRIPYYITTDNLEAFIRTKLREEGVLPPAAGSLSGMLGNFTDKQNMYKN
jgi:hypothetical protein